MLVAVNKSDNPKRELEAAEFYALGWERTYPIAAIHGRGVADLLDEIVAALPPESEAELARKRRENEAEAFSREVEEGRLEAFVVGDEDVTRTPAEDVGEPTTRSIDEAARRWDALIASESDDEPPAIALVGRPNVGKSSLLNALLKQDRMIVSRHPGHDARRDRHPAALGPDGDRADRYGGHPAARAGGRRARPPSATRRCARSGRSRAPTSRCC